MSQNNSENHFVKCEIRETIKSKEEIFPYLTFTKYIIYIDIKIKTWKICRRFKEFEKLNEELFKKYSELPNLPKKTIFSLSKGIVEERRIMLENYLNYVVNQFNLYQNPKILEFIELDKEILPLLKKKSLSVILNSKTALYLENIDILKIKSKSIENIKYEKNIKEENYRIIDNFLYNLEENEEEISDKINIFLQKIQKNWPKFENNDILKLFYGNSYDLKGLFYHCGNNIENNPLGAEKCLYFLNKLIMYEFNPFCENYITCLKMAGIEHIKRLNLNQHIKNNKSNVKNDCFNIINHYIDPEKIGIDLIGILYIEYEAKYRNWLQIKEKM